MKYLKASHLVLFFSFALSLLCLKVFRWDGPEGKNNESVIVSDGLGYYAYLPAILINKNLDNLPPNQAYINTVNGRNVNKYFIGNAILWSPFFAIAHLSAKVFNYPTSGYSSPYQLMVALASVFYLFLGLFALLQLLRLFNFSDTISAAAILLIFFGTNLFYYAVAECSMAHVYSFSMITCFAFISKKLLQTKQVKFIYLGALVLALCILIRPTNAIVVLLPLVLSSNISEFRELMAYLKKYVVHVFLVAILFVFLLSLQCVVWHKQSGMFWLWSYANEGFYFLSPEWMNVFFSFRKGLFIYTPLTLISLLAFYFLIRKQRFLFFTISAFILLFSYLISSWWNWYYGDSYGLRAFIDYYFIVALLLSFLLQNARKIAARLALGIVLTFCVALNLVQCYQYYKGILHTFSMNEEKYRYVFLQTSDTFSNVLGGNDDIEPYSTKPKQLIYSTVNDFEKAYSRWNNGTVSSNNVCNENQEYSKFCEYKLNEFGADLSIQRDSAFFLAEKIFVEASVRRLEPTQNSSSEALFVVHVLNEKNESEYYYTFRMNDVPNQKPCVWREYRYSFVIPKLKSYNDRVVIYIWNKGKQQFFIDDFTLNFYGLD